MGEMDNNGLQLFYNGKPIRQGDFGCGHITKASPSHAERMASLKAEVDAMAEKYQPVINKLMEEIFESSQKPIQPLGEATAEQISKAFEDKRKTMDNFAIALKPTKRKHYKPKFTL